MKKCSITETLNIIQTDISAYKSLSRFHYRDERFGSFDKVFAITDNRLRPVSPEYVGVIIYTIPTPAVALRNIATDGAYTGFGDKSFQTQLVNRDIRCINRVIIEPRYRGLGLASWLVEKTLPLAGVPIVESLAVMGRVNPFFEKAGMKKYEAPLDGRCVRIREALSMVGLEGCVLLDVCEVQKRIDNMNLVMRSFIEIEMKRFLQAYGTGARIAEGIKRTKYVLSRLTARPAYYIWKRE